jgi:hypothetical protein
VCGCAALAAPAGSWRTAPAPGPCLGTAPRSASATSPMPCCGSCLGCCGPGVLPRAWRPVSQGASPVSWHCSSGSACPKTKRPRSPHLTWSASLEGKPNSQGDPCRDLPGHALEFVYICGSGRSQGRYHWRPLPSRPDVCPLHALPSRGRHHEQQDTVVGGGQRQRGAGSATTHGYGGR